MYEEETLSDLRLWRLSFPGMVGCGFGEERRVALKGLTLSEGSLAGGGVVWCGVT